ncbi:MAG TPA: hypothetical protein VES67_02320 [Vicinamibacterales bacterium]|nr:hypothetical protein [Vicinamibacterales bacterium]
MAIRSQQDWISAGYRAFREMDLAYLRTDDPALIAEARDRERLSRFFTFDDGSIVGLRWVVTSGGLKLSGRACAACHIDWGPDGRVVIGGPSGSPRPPGSLPFAGPGVTLVGAPGTAFRLRQFYGVGPVPVKLWQEFTVPWAPDERVERLRTMTGAELQQAGGFARSFSDGVFARTNGSPYAATRIPDLQNLKYSRYMDATGTHRLRGPEDVARYAALVTGADRMDFGPHRILTDEQRRVRFRYADEVLHAIGVYLLSLEPPQNPNPAPREMIDLGSQVFQREGCPACHRPPAYTTGRLTLATGFTLPPDHPNRVDISTQSVGTDPDVALKTRKGTGLYKIPSLRGVWYRPRLLHDGSLTSLEELFDSARLSPDYLPKGWSPPGVTKRAVPGHTFGLDLNPREKAALLAFLRSL